MSNNGTIENNSSPQETPRRKGTLLIVDDEEGPRQSLRVIFKDDYDLLLANDGPSAIELAKNNKVDVALLDIRMSGMSGIEVLERLKYVDPAIEVVMMTAFETTDTMRQALRLRACDYINKPFDISTMRSAVSGAMQKRTLESELHTNSEKLQQLVVELQNQKIQEQMSHNRGEIYASIIHDLNGPLTVISGFIQLINQRIGNSTRLESEDLEFVRERLKTLTRQVTNCIEISRRYLGFLRGRTEDAPQVGLNQLLADLNHLLQVHHSLKDNQLSVVPLPSNMAVRMNGTDVIQMLQNLAVNALQCSPRPHSVFIEAKALTEALDLSSIKDTPNDRFLNVESFENSPPLICISVRDTGPGVPPEVLPRIFQPFFTTKSAQEGTGLGLSIVQRLIKEARGAMHIHTEVGQGTTFNLYLPAVQTGR